MSDRERGAETDEENKKLTALLTRFLNIFIIVLTLKIHIKRNF